MTVYASDLSDFAELLRAAADWKKQGQQSLRKTITLLALCAPFVRVTRARLS